GWFIRAKTERVGTVLYCHGNGGNLTNIDGIAQDLAAQGLDVLIFDYRGYGRSEGTIPDENGLYADADAAYDFLINQRGVQPEKLAIYGLSLGTTAAIDVASRRKCGALVVESGLSSASEMADIALPWLPRWLHWVGRNRFESARKIANVKCPVFVAHGTADEVIPTEQGRKLFTAAPEPKKLMIIEGGDHWLSDTVGANYLKTVGAFISDALKAGK
ncbi:MAG TPA: alpha/beta hydrolase, partial [Blastocatellia bacterium]|nr:alpha/beta hydrolase [Blastocatellia bacterium]